MRSFSFDIFKLLTKSPISLAFCFLYLVVNSLAFLLNGMKYPTNNLFTLLTAWFNLSEDFSRSYFNFYYGVVDNFVIVLFFIAIFDYYSRRSYLNNKFYFISLKYSFLLGILSTYFWSIYFFIDHHFVPSGTSIISFCLLLLYASYMIIEAIFISINGYNKGKEVPHIRQGKYQIILYIALSIVLLAFSSSYLINNSDWKFHLAGLFIFAISLFILISLKYSNEKKRFMVENSTQ